jgi:AcrR family transcriptional regulator
VALLEDRDLADARGLSARPQQSAGVGTELFAERGVDATSSDAIAATSGVSKATIYKHWADKDALCLEMMQYVRELDGGAPEVDSGDLRDPTISELPSTPATTPGKNLSGQAMWIANPVTIEAR